MSGAGLTTMRATQPAEPPSRCQLVDHGSRDARWPQHLADWLGLGDPLAAMLGHSVELALTWRVLCAPCDDMRDRRLLRAGSAPTGCLWKWCFTCDHQQPRI